ncbi:uncharacterized protein Nmag_0961 [Natrialba magadii ATCC 43099]|uniref:Uncharacterized protein n=1 Tax=Natrialba magadii (strain ATCC 43099 / DSM 3394 / CCM 3739 / CIP 104546 / IAM 13178 / JCM 8861 / NBRC 102185 / NCIMB 2190 / MS3) TaxID=547559 RepID=D3SQQ7_NATMM|nr:hypothetical protein [Natrialba magadii]ADD04545.1 uncharacterized protein Nmag_0961 [Natrialba magadii ATCC 43099]ELY25202.1 hypothetical protein C500_17331 [Natrialba magadii ATCC 43099]
MSETALEYQKHVLATVIDEAVYVGTASEAEAKQLHDRLADVESMQSVDQLWDDLSREYEVLERKEIA